jgi:uncharacterized membrane protein YhaH (DUF805 family)
MSWYFTVLGKYAVFTGRARRKEYWSFTLINLVITACWLLFDRIIFGPDEYLFSLILVLYGLIIFLPSVAVYIRRIHDTDHSGWWLLPSWVPILGIPFILYFTLRNSSDGENQYGENPKGIDNNSVGDENLKSTVESDSGKEKLMGDEAQAMIKELSKKNNGEKGTYTNKIKNSIMSKGTTFPKKTTVKQIPSHSKRGRSKMKEKNDITLNENELYEQIWKEIEENKTDVGLWANCFSNCEGDENKTKALYASKRVLILKENLQKQLIDQERKVKEESKKETVKKLLVAKGKTDNMEIFKQTLESMPTFFPKILDKFGYKLVKNKNRQEMWSIHLPTGTGVQHVYNLFDLRTEIRRIIIKGVETIQFVCGL